MTWSTRHEASEHLRMSVDTIDRLLVPMSKHRTEGRIRYQRMNIARKLKPIRLLRSDILAILPEPNRRAA